MTAQTTAEEPAVGDLWLGQNLPPSEAQVFGLILLTVWFGFCSLLEAA